MVEFLTPPPPPPPPPWGPSVATMEPPAAEWQAAIGARRVSPRIERRWRAERHVRRLDVVFIRAERRWCLHCGVHRLGGARFLYRILVRRRRLLARQARERLDTQQSPWMGLEAEVAADAYGWD